LSDITIGSAICSSLLNKNPFSCHLLQVFNCNGTCHIACEVCSYTVRLCPGCRNTSPKTTHIPKSQGVMILSWKYSK
jgi:hypothetical protein